MPSFWSFSLIFLSSKSIIGNIIRISAAQLNFPSLSLSLPWLYSPSPLSILLSINAITSFFLLFSYLLPSIHLIPFHSIPLSLSLATQHSIFTYNTEYLSKQYQIYIKIHAVDSFASIKIRDDFSLSFFFHSPHYYPKTAAER